MEIIHSNGGLLGFGAPLGQADFFPNFGRWQPGCGWDITGSCSHSRAVEYFGKLSFSVSEPVCGTLETDKIIENAFK